MNKLSLAILIISAAPSLHAMQLKSASQGFQDPTTALFDAIAMGSAARVRRALMAKADPLTARNINGTHMTALELAVQTAILEDKFDPLNRPTMDIIFLLLSHKAPITENVFKTIRACSPSEGSSSFHSQKEKEDKGFRDLVSRADAIEKLLRQRKALQLID